MMAGDNVKNLKEVLLENVLSNTFFYGFFSVKPTCLRASGLYVTYCVISLFKLFFMTAVNLFIF